MKVFKFGGGVIKDAESIRRMTDIVRDSPINQGRIGLEDSGLLVVVSAFGKMTNSFEDLLIAANNDMLGSKLDEILDFHNDIASQLLKESLGLWKKECSSLIEKIKKTLVEVKDYPRDKGYDQLVAYGELFSTTLISVYWNQEGLSHRFLDSRELIRTDDNYCEAKVNWEETGKQVRPFQESLLLVQGFIGGSDDGFTTTLGREGSDYSAAIFGNLLNAQEVVIWKDVSGVLTADPSEFPDACKMDEISYLEAVELTYFGAKVIHPNTIKPLQNKGIALIVKSLYDPNASGTVILNKTGEYCDKPIVIKKRNQVLVSIQPRDFSFIVEESMAKIFDVLSRNRTRINLMQHGAVSISLVFDWNQKRLDAILGELLPEFKVLYNTGLELLTIRHYSDTAIRELTKGKQIYVQQQSRKTARFVLG